MANERTQGRDLVTGDALRESRFLAALDVETREDLAVRIERVALKVRDPVYEFDKPIDFVYFPIEGVISMVAKGAPELSVEVATIGNEGMAGLHLFLGSRTTPGDAFSQVSGEAFRMNADDFLSATGDNGSFTKLLHRYTLALLVQISQSTACNRIHSAPERCARWLLTTHDRVRGDEFDLTQAFLAQMLGMRRANVNVVASALQHAGFIRYARGHMEVLDRSGLEESSCACYKIVRNEYDRLLGTHGNPP